MGEVRRAGSVQPDAIRNMAPTTPAPKEPSTPGPDDKIPSDKDSFEIHYLLRTC